MGAGNFAATTRATRTAASVEVKASHLTPPDQVPYLDANDDKLPDVVNPNGWMTTFSVEPVDADDAVTTLVKREISTLQGTIHSIQNTIDRHAYGLREAEDRKRQVEAQVTKLATFLGSGA